MYATGDAITVRVTFPQTIQSAMGASLNIRIGENTRAASAPNCSTGCGMTLDFSYTIATADYDADGVTAATNALSATALTHSQAGTPHSFSLTLPDTLARPQSDHRVNLGDYDRDDDGLIEVSTLDHLNAIRYDLDGDGGVSATDATNYTAAFLNRSATMGCPTTTADADNNDCVGYELAENLDFDTDGDGDVDSSDAYPNWSPIGGSSAFASRFEGNNRTISNLKIDAALQRAGLFSALTGTVSGLGLIDADINTSASANALAGVLTGYMLTSGIARASYATGAVSTSGNTTFSGGLAGWMNGGTVESVWASVNVSATGSTNYVGGLVGYMSNNGNARAAYAAGAVAASGANSQVGGLFGRAALSTVAASYATGAVSVSGTGSVSGGFYGAAGSSLSTTASYWDVNVTGIDDDSDSNMPEGKTASELQSITDYSGIFANWNVNVDGVAGNDDPWYFGKAMQYPMLKFGGMSVVAQGSLAMGMPSANGNHPVVGQEAGVCLVDEDGTPNAVHMRARRAGEPTRKAPWQWRKSTDGKTWTDITEDGGPTYRYTPVSGDAGNYLRACVALNDSAPDGVDEACVRMFAKVKSSG